MSLPNAPTGLKAEIVRGISVKLSWDAVENADYYRLYIGDEVVADELPGTSVSSSGGVNTFSAYSVAACVSGVFSPKSEPVYVFLSGDDTQTEPGLITDRTLNDVIRHTEKGCYNYTDLNRVTAAAIYLRGLLEPLGYSTKEIYERFWEINEIPRQLDFYLHMRSVKRQDVLNYSKDLISLPVTLDQLTHTTANDIERFLYLSIRAAEHIPESYIYSGEIYGGEYI